MTEELIYEPFARMKFDYNHCFLCGVELIKENKTDEHVIPTWLQHRHQLWNQKLTLLNQTEIAYRQLKIPCCKVCNNEHLGDIEKQVEYASASYEEFIKLDKFVVFQWLTKLYYGLLFKNLSLAVDRRNPQQGTIVTKESLARYRMIHEFLQSTRINISFPKDVFSLFIFKLHLSPTNNCKADFFFTDDHERAQLAIQIGEIGVVCCIGEDGIINHSLEKYLEPFQGPKLHGIQFAEIIAKVFYRRVCLEVTPNYILASGKGNYTILSNLSSLSGHYFRPTNYAELAAITAWQQSRFGIKFKQIYNEKYDAIVSFLINENGELHLLDQQAKPLSNVHIKHENFEGKTFPNENPIIVTGPES